MHNEIFTPEQLFSQIKNTVALAALVGDFSWSAALRISHMVWDIIPADFPLYADALITNGPKCAFWDIEHIAREVPGGWDLYVAARDARSQMV